MKRFFLLASACVFLLGSVTAASAVDIKASGFWEFNFGWADNYRGNMGVGDPGQKDKSNGNGTDAFNARHRVRTQIEFVASEQLKGVLLMEIGEIYWGRDGTTASSGRKTGQGSGGDLDADGVNVETKRAYLDWMIPNTDVTVRMGIQGIYLPTATGYYNPVFGTDCAGILISSPVTEWLGVTAFWVRAFDRYDDDYADGVVRNRLDEMDVFGLILPVTLEGMKITPWGLWSRIGGESGYWGYHGKGYGSTADGGFQGSTNAYFAGLGYELTMFDPLTFAFDVTYGWMHGNQGIGNYDADSTAWDTTKSNPGARGWFVDAALRYKMDWATAGLFGWWASGDKANAVDDGQFGRIPLLADDQGFTPTSFGFDGSPVLISSDRAVSSTGVGMWGLGVELKDISFLEDLTHTIRFAYYRGTNDHEVIENYGDKWRSGTGRRMGIVNFGERQYMTDKDQAFEVNFDHKYQLYENLAMFLELGWIRMDLDEGVWENANRRHDGGTDDAWKAMVSFQFKF